MASIEMQQAGEALRSRSAIAPPTLERARQEFDAAAMPLPSDTTMVAVDAGGVAADWVTAPAIDPDRRLLLLHGGGYVIGSRVSHRRLASDLSRATGCAVLIIDYRLAPEAPFPGALHDAVSALLWMRDHGPRGATPATATFIAGDSAGGGLAISTLVALRDAREPQPDGAVTMSAWTDLALTGDSVQTRAQVDAGFAGGVDALRRSARAYLGQADLHTPLASPLYGDLRGLPPLLMQVGDDEILLDDTVRLAERARTQDVTVALHVTPGAFHDYQYLVPDAPEAHSAFDQIGAFVRALGLP
jgi:monoterpene epsilon-lactone hydrolase